MGPLEKFMEFIKDFVVDGGRRYLERKLFDFLWERIKPVLLKAGKKLWQILKDKLQKMKKKWLDIKERHRKRACVPPQTLIFMNEHRKDNHSYVILIMIIANQKHMIIIIVISLK